MIEVVPGRLYQGSLEEISSLLERGEGQELGLKAVLTVAKEVPSPIPPGSSLIHLRLPVDEMNFTPHGFFDLAVDLQVFPLFVHCSQGVVRSRVFAAAITHKVFEMPLEEAVKIAQAPKANLVYLSMIRWVKD